MGQDCIANCGNRRLNQENNIGRLPPVSGQLTDPTFSNQHLMHQRIKEFISSIVKKSYNPEENVIVAAHHKKSPSGSNNGTTSAASTQEDAYNKGGDTY